MKRILEPELMVDDAQALAYARADFEEPHSNFISLFKESFPKEEINGFVLDLGCGPGDITFRFARAYPQCFIHGVDGAEAMLNCGRNLLSRADDIRNRVELLQGVLPEARLPRTEYDVIISNSLLHHLHNPQVLWETVRQYACMHALVFVMDLKRPASLDEAKKLKEKYSNKEPEILQHDFYHSLLAAFEIAEVEQQLEEVGLEGLSVKEVSDRHFVVWGRYS